ncbi:MAG: hypothetical protein OMM_04241 [Candidatus Magnetoglobus multicellularis str. Araruama]|uniref:Uncharacterized protein n=1 Tax=Candidatus Magnetoglobus multicellularis str. Araruama TaxID=890399 RepID=A0A1V1P2K6_9BACT|nr:MAG: hypothetical protein OMM_04241 [Candidatus Magnetoglobus multicellularis str. Araruama]
MPTYPFDKKRYWIHQKENIQPGTITSQTSQLHPLVHQNISDLEAQQFSTVLTGTEFFLKDHVVNSNKTLPGVAYLEMAFFACKQSTKASFLEMVDIVWIQPVVFEDTPKEIIIQLHPSNNQIDFQIKLNTSDSQDQLFTQGKLIAGNPPLKETINIAEIQSRCSQPSDTKEIYNNFHKNGYEYGPTFQPIKKLYMGENESLSHLILPVQAQNNFNQYELHPSLMDGALQTISGITFAKTSDDIFMPFSIKRIIYCQPLPVSCFAYASMKADSDTQKFDISIVDESGIVCVKIIDFTLRPIPKKELPEMIYFKPQWQPKEIELSESSIQEKVLIFTNNNSDAFKFLCPNHIIVNAGESFEQLSETHFCIRPDNGKDYQQLISHTGLPEYILHCWSKEGFQSDETSINQALTESFYSLFHLTQTLIANKLSTPLSIVYVCSMDHPIFNSLSAFAKTVHQENPLLFCKTLILDQSSNLSDCVIKELIQRDAFEVRYIQNNRDIRSLQKEIVLPNNESPHYFKENGVYLITGGTGGIGTILTSYLAKTCHAKIALCGRHATPYQTQIELWKNYSQNDTEIHYFQADLSVQNDVLSLIQNIKKKLGSINGVFHCAGKINDAFIIRKNVDDIMDVISPKIFGTCYLDEALKSEELDFFVLFSSTSAVLGNVGQCDYAFANCFMDHFSWYRNHLADSQKRWGKTISINWPLWQNGGMDVDNAIKAEFAHLGIIPLSDEKAIDCLKTAMHLNQTQLIPFEGFPHKIDAMITQINQPQISIKQTSESDTINRNAFSDQQVDDFLKQILSEETHLKPSKIDMNAPLEKYGIDSIMVVKLTNRLEKVFGSLSKTLFFEYQTLSELKEYFISSYAHILHKKFQPENNVQVKNIQEKVSPIQFSTRFIAPETANKRPDSKDQDIAIIGVSGRYPMADDLFSFWENLRTGKDCITEIPASRFDVSYLYHPDRQKEGIIYGKWGGFINDVDKFDALFLIYLLVKQKS